MRAKATILLDASNKGRTKLSVEQPQYMKTKSINAPMPWIVQRAGCFGEETNVSAHVKWLGDRVPEVH